MPEYTVASRDIPYSSRELHLEDWYELMALWQRWSSRSPLARVMTELHEHGYLAGFGPRR